MSQNVTQNNTNNAGCGFLGLLFLVFLVLKLTGYIAWSWWWVTAPLWGGFAFLMAVLSIAAIVMWRKL